jgi:hypothetical protein
MQFNAGLDCSLATFTMVKFKASNRALTLIETPVNSCLTIDSVKFKGVDSYGWVLYLFFLGRFKNRIVLRSIEI